MLLSIISAVCAACRRVSHAGERVARTPFGRLLLVVLLLLFVFSVFSVTVWFILLLFMGWLCDRMVSWRLHLPS